MEQRLTFDAEDCSPRVISAAAPVQTAVEEEEAAAAAAAHFTGEEEEEEGYEGGEDDFEFSFVPRDPEITDADDIFADGRIRAAYPVFNRDVAEASAVGLLPFAKMRIDAERDRDLDAASTSSCSCSCSSSESDDLEGAPAETFCLWRPAPPSPEMTKKSNSTGRLSRRWRIRDFVVGRSHSDGKEKFVYLPMEAPRTGEDRKASKLRPRKAGEEEAVAAAQGKKAAGGKQGKGGEMDMVTAYRLYYAKGGAHDRRQTYLPYRKDVVGFFGGVQASTRSGFNPF